VVRTGGFRHRHTHKHTDTDTQAQANQEERRVMTDNTNRCTSLGLVRLPLDVGLVSELPRGHQVADEEGNTKDHANGAHHNVGNAEKRVLASQPRCGRDHQ